MDIYTLERIKSRYPVDLDSDHCESQTKYVDSLMQWPSNKYFQPWQQEKLILSEALSPMELPNSYSETLADQVFGRQAREGKLLIKHTANLVAHRYQLHKRHVSDINHRIMGLQGRISILTMRDPWQASKPQIDLEKMLAKLETEKRDEQVAFWKDTLKLRQELLGGAREYQASRHRADILRGVEAGYGRVE